MILSGIKQMQTFALFFLILFGVVQPLFAEETSSKEELLFLDDEEDAVDRASE